MTRIHTIFGLGGLMVVLSIGCGDAVKFYAVSGTVTYDGKPLDGASVLLIPQQGSTGMGTTDAAGKFTISTAGEPGAPVGKYDVTISKQTYSGPPIPKDPKPEDMAKIAASKARAIYQSVIPEKYAIPRGGSGLSATVTEDAAKNVFDFPLTP